MIATIDVWKTIQDEFTCTHECSRLTKFVKSNGAVCIREQCSQCGENVKEIPKKGHDVDQLPDWDKELRERWFNAQSERRAELSEQKQAAIAEEMKEKDEQWWRQYNEYLRTQHWHDIRKKVLDRDGGVCQACLRNKATTAHHLSYNLYNLLGRSAAFELVAICHTCHKTIHPRMAETQNNLILYNPYLNGGNNDRA